MGNFSKYLYSVINISFVGNIACLIIINLTVNSLIQMPRIKLQAIIGAITYGNVFCGGSVSVW